MLTYDFSPLYRSTVGFDRLARLAEEALSGDGTGGGFPPYNIEQPAEDRYRVAMAVAGFAPEELSIDYRENQLVVSGAKPKDAEDGRIYLHRGIAARDFVRSFSLADHVRVEGARLENGLLLIDLVRELPEALKPRKIEIGATPGAKALGKAA